MIPFNVKLKFGIVLSLKKQIAQIFLVKFCNDLTLGARGVVW